ncbi:hypothetical protein CapIbe_009085 [Capra ibex]
MRKLSHVKAKQPPPNPAADSTCRECVPLGRTQNQGMPLWKSPWRPLSSARIFQNRKPEKIEVGFAVP